MKRRRRGWLRRLARFALYAGLALVAVVALLRLVPPPTTYLIERERVRLGGVARDWRPLGEIAPNLARAVVAAEDSRFCDHWGIDVAAVEQALEERARGRVRGASTITQQTAKNVFLWPDPSWARKAIEAGFALAIEALWGKRRILEVYLNVAEMGEGVFGAEAAARHWFGKSADALTLAESARLAAILPSPRTRDPRRPTDFLARRARAIASGAETLRAAGRDACFAR